MSGILFLVGAAILLIGSLLFAMVYRISGLSGGTTTIYIGATHDMLNEDQRKAAEVIVEEKSGNKKLNRIPARIKKAP